MKILTKLVAMILVFALALGLIPIDAMAAKKTKLNKTKVMLTVGKTVKLKLRNAPKGKKIKWKSNKKKIATVTKKGKVTAKKAGKAKITAKVGRKKYTCTVTVKKKKNTTESPTPSVTENPELPTPDPSEPVTDTESTIQPVTENPELPTPSTSESLESPTPEPVTDTESPTPPATENPKPQTPPVSENPKPSTPSPSPVTGTIKFILDKEYEVSFSSDSQVALSTPDTNVPGRAFHGWTTQEGGEVVIEADESIYYETIADLIGSDGNVMLYPVYSDIAIITFIVKGISTVVTLDSELVDEAIAPDAKSGGMIFVGWTNVEEGNEVLIAADVVINYSTVEAYRDKEGKVLLYPVYRTLLHDGIQLYQYFKPPTLPRIDINTEDGIALDDPSLISDTERKGIRGELRVYNYTNAEISVTNTEEEYVLENIKAQVKIRGNYTSAFAKKPIRIKFDKKQAMVGLSDGKKFKSWVLLAEWADSSILQNSVAAYLGSALLESDGYYVTDFRYVQVYLNGSYNGLYLLVEQQQVNENRVNLPEPENPDDYDLDNLTTEEYEAIYGVHIGYFIEYDGYYKNEAELEQFTVVYDQIRHYGTDNNGMIFDPMVYRSTNGGFSISSDIYSREQHDFIQKAIQTIWDVVYDATYNPHSNLATQPYHTMNVEGEYVEAPGITTAYDAVASVIDVRSLVDMYILCEIAQDYDIAWSSFYFALDMSADGNRLLTYTAPWDFDSALGNSIHDSVGVSATTGRLANKQQLINEGRLIQEGNSYFFAENAVLTPDDFTFSNTEILYAANTGNPWLVVCANQDWFWQLVNERWEEAVEAGVIIGAIEMIDIYIRNYMPKTMH